jgi:hypothetical protein
MKKSFAIIAFILLCFGINVMAGGESTSYVKANGKVYFGQDLKTGLLKMKIISSDGSVIKVSNRDVEAYMHDSRLFERLPVVCDNNEILCEAMMEYITSRSGLKLYRYFHTEMNVSSYSYYVFKDGKFYLRIDETNAEATLPFFGIKVL